MKEEKETKERLLASAKKEFVEKGYLQASLRNICKNAGVTTGALYFFFRDKEDLFAAIVEEPLQCLRKIMEEHYAYEITHEEGQIKDGEVDETDINATVQIIHVLYQYYDEFQVILTKAQGSRYENWLDEFVKISEHHYRVLADRITDKQGLPRVEDYMIHWIAHLQVDVFVHLRIHEKDEAAAIRHMNSIIKFMIAGWTALFVK